jgi:hypothetical protein
METAGKLNKEIGLGASEPGAGSVTIVFKSNVDPSKLWVAASRALPVKPA